MSKDLSVSVLMDFYGGLLTEKQFDTLDMYYNNDFSLAEIAQNLDISRQGVRDFILRGEKQLHEFEEKLGMAGQSAEMQKSIEQMEKTITALSSENLNDKKSELLELTARLKKLI